MSFPYPPVWNGLQQTPFEIITDHETLIHFSTKRLELLVVQVCMIGYGPRWY
jgi:hypothetical protein